jgi:hypothetical protein
MSRSFTSLILATTAASRRSSPVLSTRAFLEWPFLLRCVAQPLHSFHRLLLHYLTGAKTSSAKASWRAYPPPTRSLRCFVMGLPCQVRSRSGTGQNVGQSIPIIKSVLKHLIMAQLLHPLCEKTPSIDTLFDHLQTTHSSLA